MREQTSESHGLSRRRFLVGTAAAAAATAALPGRGAGPGAPGRADRRLSGGC
jgi:hypothetical protein